MPLTATAPARDAPAGETKTTASGTVVSMRWALGPETMGRELEEAQR